ncbi:MAG: hypothetical protein WC900_07040, partial [Oscillospiraceae bacterium]
LGSNSIFIYGGVSFKPATTLSITNDSGLKGGFYSAVDTIVSTQTIFNLTKQNVSIFDANMTLNNPAKFANYSPKADNTDGYINIGGILDNGTSAFYVGQTDKNLSTATMPVDIYCSKADIGLLYQTGNFYCYAATDTREIGNGDLRTDGEVIINGDLYVEGDLLIDGNGGLTVTGNLFVKGNIYAISSAGGYGITVNGYTECHGSMQYNSGNGGVFAGDVYVAGNLEDKNSNTKQDVFGSTVYVGGTSNVSSITTPPAVVPAAKTFPNDVIYAEGDTARGNRPELKEPDEVFNYDATPVEMLSDTSNEKYIGDQLSTDLATTTNISSSCDLSGLVLNNGDQVDISVTTSDIFITVPSDYDFKKSVFVIDNPTTDKFVYFVVDQPGDGVTKINMNGLTMLSRDTFDGLGATVNSDGSVSYSNGLYYGDLASPNSNYYKPGEIKTFFIVNDGNVLSMDSTNSGPGLIEACMFGPGSKIISNKGTNFNILNQDGTVDTHDVQVLGAAIFDEITGANKPTFMFYAPAAGSLFDGSGSGGASVTITVEQYDKN